MAEDSKLKHYCTLFDQSYLSRGLVMIESLLRYSPDANIYVVAFDREAHRVLSELGNANVIPIFVEEIEDEELLNVKKERSKGEYCWTCTPAVILYCIEHFKLPGVTYLDADLFFFSSPEILIEEMKSGSVLITPHWYTQKYDQTERSGIYCVQFMTFRSDRDGMVCLKWWRERCIEWCYARFEDGKFGDQKYLDDWTSRFPGVHVLENRGGGIAPWNVQQWHFEGDAMFVESNGHLTPRAPVFYHFHALKRISRKRAFIGDYFISDGAIRHFYRPYLAALLEKDAFLYDSFNVPISLSDGNIGFIQAAKRLIKNGRNYLKT